MDLGLKSSSDSLFLIGATDPTTRRDTGLGVTGWKIRRHRGMGLRHLKRHTVSMGDIEDNGRRACPDDGASVNDVISLSCRSFPQISPSSDGVKKKLIDDGVPLPSTIRNQGGAEAVNNTNHYCSNNAKSNTGGSFEINTCTAQTKTNTNNYYSVLNNNNNNNNKCTNSQSSNNKNNNSNNNNCTNSQSNNNNSNNNNNNNCTNSQSNSNNNHSHGGEMDTTFSKNENLQNNYCSDKTETISERTSNNKDDTLINTTARPNHDAINSLNRRSQVLQNLTPVSTMPNYVDDRKGGNFCWYKTRRPEMRYSYSIVTPVLDLQTGCVPPGIVRGNSVGPIGQNPTTTCENSVLTSSITSRLSYETKFRYRFSQQRHNNMAMNRAGRIGSARKLNNSARATTAHCKTISECSSPRMSSSPFVPTSSTLQNINIASHTNTAKSGHNDVIVNADTSHPVDSVVSRILQRHQRQIEETRQQVLDRNQRLGKLFPPVNRRTDSMTELVTSKGKGHLSRKRSSSEPGKQFQGNLSGNRTGDSNADMETVGKNSLEDFRAMNKNINPEDITKIENANPDPDNIEIFYSDYLFNNNERSRDKDCKNEKIETDNQEKCSRINTLQESLIDGLSPTVNSERNGDALEKDGNVSEKTVLNTRQSVSTKTKIDSLEPKSRNLKVENEIDGGDNCVEGQSFNNGSDIKSGSTDSDMGNDKTNGTAGASEGAVLKSKDTNNSFESGGPPNGSDTRIGPAKNEDLVYPVHKSVGEFRVRGLPHENGSSTDTTGKHLDKYNNTNKSDAESYNQTNDGKEKERENSLMISVDDLSPKRDKAEQRDTKLQSESDPVRNYILNPKNTVRENGDNQNGDEDDTVSDDVNSDHRNIPNNPDVSKTADEDSCNDSSNTFDTNIPTKSDKKVSEWIVFRDYKTTGRGGYGDKYNVWTRSEQGQSTTNAGGGTMDAKTVDSGKRLDQPQPVQQGSNCSLNQTSENGSHVAQNKSHVANTETLRRVKVDNKSRNTNNKNNNHNYNNINKISLQTRKPQQQQHKQKHFTSRPASKIYWKFTDTAILRNKTCNNPDMFLPNRSAFNETHQWRPSSRDSNGRVLQWHQEVVLPHGSRRPRSTNTARSITNLDQRNNSSYNYSSNSNYYNSNNNYYNSNMNSTIRNGRGMFRIGSAGTVNDFLAGSASPFHGHNRPLSREEGLGNHQNMGTSRPSSQQVLRRPRQTMNNINISDNTGTKSDEAQAIQIVQNAQESQLVGPNNLNHHHHRRHHPHQDKSIDLDNKQEMLDYFWSYQVMSRQMFKENLGNRQEGTGQGKQSSKIRDSADVKTNGLLPFKSAGFDRDEVTDYNTSDMMGVNGSIPHDVTNSHVQDGDVNDLVSQNEKRKMHLVVKLPDVA